MLNKKVFTNDHCHQHYSIIKPFADISSKDHQNGFIRVKIHGFISCDIRLKNKTVKADNIRLKAAKVG